MVLVHDTLSHCALQVYYIMFHLNSFNGCQLTERTRNCIYLCYKGNNLKIYMQELWFLCMHDTSSQCALQMYEVSLKYL